jgi:hypothetical protein
MAARTPAWDVLTALRGRPGALPGALAAADAAVHAHAKTPRPGFARALSRVKAVALRGVADESAAAVLQVLPALPISDSCRQRRGGAHCDRIRAWQGAAPRPPAPNHRHDARIMLRGACAARQPV